MGYCFPIRNAADPLACTTTTENLEAMHENPLNQPPSHVATSLWLVAVYHQTKNTPMQRYETNEKS